MIDFRLPSLGADMDQAKLNRWLVKPGDRVHKGQIIAEVETEKAVLEVECWDEGVVTELVVEPGPTKLQVGTVLARIDPLEERLAPVTGVGAPVATTPVDGAVFIPPTPAPTLTPASAPRGHVSPPVRHLAHQLGVSLNRVSGSGPGGEVTRADVKAAAVITGDQSRVKASPMARRLAGERGLDLTGLVGSGIDGMVVSRDLGKPAASPEPSADTGPTGVEGRAETMRRAIARSMSHSKREIPHYYLGNHVDLSKTLTWLDARNEERSIAERVLPAALLLKATALALRETPDLNGHWIDDGFRPSEAIHLGVAVSLREGGLVAPAIHDADRLDIDQMMVALRDLVNRARSWRLRSSEMSDPTITVTNLGERGVETAFPVIIPPQVAIVGFGRIIESPVAVDGKVVVHPMVHASLAADHRVTDGHRGGLFLDALDRWLQKPEAL